MERDYVNAEDGVEGLRPRTGVVLAAAGSGERFGGDKQSAFLGGKAVILHSLDVLDASIFVHGIVVVVSDSNMESIRNMVNKGNYKKVQAVVKGGKRRQDSVAAGMRVLEMSGRFDLVLVHDGARPFIDSELIRRSVEAADKFGAAVAAVPVRDTIKTVSANTGKLSEGLVVEFTPKRELLYAAQTPQAFKWDLLKRAHDEVTDDCTDDAAMAELAGAKVIMFEGSHHNIKITRKEDLAVADAIMGLMRNDIPADTGEWRWGTGFDCHRFENEESGTLKLGGVDVDFPFGLEGHSDGDVLLHATASAILGGAGVGDLGQHFPSSDERWRNANSADLLKICTGKAQTAGWEVKGIDATIIAQKPRLAAYQKTFETNIGNCLGLPVGRVNVKVTSTDKLGVVGSGKGIAAEAIATMKSI